MRTKMPAMIVLLFIAGCTIQPIQPQPQGAFQSPIASARYRYYVPFVVAELAPTTTPTPTCFKSAVAEQFYRLMLADARQQRSTIVCDPRLVATAELRANDLIKRDYFAHCDPDGRCANAVAISAGCRLPSDYPTNGNSLEELGGGTPNADAMFAALARSPSHKIHLFGENDFFRAQQQTGIAMVTGGRFGFIWVVLIGTCG